MNDQNNNSNPASVPTSAPVVNNPAPVTDVPAAPVAQAPDADLQKLSQDLQNLAQEATTAPATPAEPAVAEPAAPAAAPVMPVEPSMPKMDAPAPAAEVAKPESQVTIYVTANCPFCKAEKEYLTSKNISFSEKNVEESTDNLKEMLALSDNFAGVPVSVLNGPKGKKTVKGFTQDEFEEELVAVGLLDAVSAPKAEASLEEKSEEVNMAPEPAMPAQTPEPAMPAEPVVPESPVPTAPTAPTMPPMPDLNAAPGSTDTPTQ
jgi:glutaredoxin